MESGREIEHEHLSVGAVGQHDPVFAVFLKQHGIASTDSMPINGERTSHEMHIAFSAWFQVKLPGSLCLHSHHSPAIRLNLAFCHLWQTVTDAVPGRFEVYIDVFVWSYLRIIIKGACRNLKPRCVVRRHRYG